MNGKKNRLGFVVLLLFIGGVFYANAHDLEENSLPHHWISAEVNYIGLGLRYEYRVNPHFSVGLYGHFHTMYQPYIYTSDSLLFGVVGSLYPFAGTFFLDLGLGYSLNYGSSNFPGPSIIPGFGWKIDFGKPGSFFISTGIKFPFTIGERQELINDQPTYTIEMKTDIVVFLGLGYSF